MKHKPVLKLEESGINILGNKNFILKLDGKVIRKDYEYREELDYYYSNENWDPGNYLPVRKINNIPCSDFPDLVQLTVSLDLVLFESQTCLVEIMRRGKKLKLSYDLCFNTHANKAFIWSNYWFVIFLREHFTNPPYKLPPQFEPDDLEGEASVTVEHMVLCAGNIEDILKPDLKYFAEAVEKTNQRMLAEARKFKKKVTAKKTPKRSKLNQISGNTPESPTNIPSSRSNLIS